MRRTRPGSAVGRLGAIGLLLVAIGGCQDAQPREEASGQAAQTGMDAGSAADTSEDGVLEVRLGAIGGSRPTASMRPRDPFAFGQGSRGAGAGPGGVSRVPVIEAPSTGPIAVAPVRPRVRIQMIGLVEGAETTGRIAVLTDGDHVFHGRAGEIVEGRYRVIMVGPDSVQLESVHDGQIQTLRLAAM